MNSFLRSLTFTAVFITTGCLLNSSVGQTPEKYNSAYILQQIQKLKVTASVLYIAAHPDDENTRLLSYLANDRLVRTGYLSLTRGDGGQNLIGNEQGVALGLIRTQELLAARRIDGAEQFFTRAYDFGYSKSSDEAFRIWDKEKVLYDVVWIIRKFKPDVIIARFPGDERAGHGHHAASGILAREAFEAAADSTRFPDQLKFGLRPWKATRVLWNTFNFGNNNTINENQFKLDVGSYLPLLGQSIGELAADSRSQHKSQGFGVPSSRGEAFEHFETLGGSAPAKDLFDGVKKKWADYFLPDIDAYIDQIISRFNPMKPSASVSDLAELQRRITYQFVKLDDSLPAVASASDLVSRKADEIGNLIRLCSGLYFEAISNEQYAVSGDSMNVRISAINRSEVEMTNVVIRFNDSAYQLAKRLPANTPVAISLRVPVKKQPLDDQPYWLVNAMNEGSFEIANKTKIGVPENFRDDMTIRITMEGYNFTYWIPLQYKYTDPVRGEIYQPVIIVPAMLVSVSPGVILTNLVPKKPGFVQVNYHALSDIPVGKKAAGFFTGASLTTRALPESALQKNAIGNVLFSVDSIMPKKFNTELSATFLAKDTTGRNMSFNNDMRLINYDHIPTVHYLFQSKVKVINDEIRTVGSRVGYIRGAGDNVPDALKALGYEVVYLDEADITTEKLRGLDAVITGVRAYNVNAYLSDKYEVLMEYVKAGGNLIVQYNTNSMVGPIKARLSPYPLNISRTRITDEKSAVRFALPNHPVLNYPNKISPSDFDNWVQERGIYFAEQLAPEYQAPLLMNDPDEKETNGSLVIADYGKGKFVYTGIVFFRQLPAGVTGAYRLLANIIALNKRK